MCRCVGSFSFRANGRGPTPSGLRRRATGRRALSCPAGRNGDRDRVGPIGSSIHVSLPNSNARFPSEQRSCALRYALSPNLPLRRICLRSYVWCSELDTTLYLLILLHQVRHHWSLSFINLRRSGIDFTRPYLMGGQGDWTRDIESLFYL